MVSVQASALFPDAEEVHTWKQQKHKYSPRYFPGTPAVTPVLADSIKQSSAFSLHAFSLSISYTLACQAHVPG